MIKKYIYSNKVSEDVKKAQLKFKKMEEKEKLQEINLTVVTIDDALTAIKQSIEFINSKKPVLVANDLISSAVISGIDSSAQLKVNDTDKASLLANKIKKYIISAIRGSIVL